MLVIVYTNGCVSNGYVSNELDKDALQNALGIYAQEIYGPSPSIRLMQAWINSPSSSQLPWVSKHWMYCSTLC